MIFFFIHVIYVVFVVILRWPGIGTSLSVKCSEVSSLVVVL